MKKSLIRILQWLTKEPQLLPPPVYLDKLIEQAIKKPAPPKQIAALTGHSIEYDAAIIAAAMLGVNYDPLKMLAVLSHLYGICMANSPDIVAIDALGNKITNDNVQDTFFKNCQEARLEARVKSKLKPTMH